MDGKKQETAEQHLNKKHIKETADHFLDEGKKLASDMYDDGLKKINSVQKEAQEYTEELLNKVRENPLKSVLIAGGIGLLLSILLKK